jgi:hypothetical protein
VIYLSPKISLINWFIAGSLNLHDEPESQLNDAGPLISSVRKSDISIKHNLILQYWGSDLDYLALTYTSILSAQHSLRNALTFYMFTFVQGAVGIVPDVDARGASVERTVERLFITDPKFETASFIFRFAAECDLWKFAPELIQNFPV